VQSLIARQALAAFTIAVWFEHIDVAVACAVQFCLHASRAACPTDPASGVQLKALSQPCWQSAMKSLPPLGLLLPHP
jgi:hypothetical protein